MNLDVRRVLSVLGVVFSAYLAARGFVWTPHEMRMPLLAVAAVCAFVVVTAVCIFVPGRAAPAGPGAVMTAGVSGPTALPMWACAVAMATAAAVPWLVAAAVVPTPRPGVAATWYVGALGLLLTVVMIRRQAWCAWVGTAALAASAMGGLGVMTALGSGLAGSVMWVLAAQLLLGMIDRAARDTARLAELQRAASARRAAALGRRRERRLQVRRALAVAGPILARTVQTGGMLDDAERAQARTAEGTLRDELRGGALLDDAVRAEIARARARGARVSIVDSGGLDAVTPDQAATVRAALAEILGTARSELVFIRSSVDLAVAATVVGRSPTAVSTPDDDDVDLWREIPRPR